MELFAEFIAKWAHRDCPPEKIGPEQFAAVEARLGTLPPSYKSAIAIHGLPSPGTSLLEAINDDDLDLPDVSEFLTPHEIVNSTEGWRQCGLPAELVVFASDCLGNLFCFKGGGDAVWLFDHDFEEAEEVAPSFRDWIAAYCAIEQLPHRAFS
jgi:hypothetical protein